MKKLIALLMLLTVMANAQESWELPVKNDLINFEFKEEFSNKKKLSSYFNTQLGIDAASKINSDLSGKGGKLLSNTNNQVSFYILGAHGKDTVEFPMTIITKKNEMNLAGVKSTFNTIKCKVRVIFTSPTTMVLKVRGFVLTGFKYTLKQGTERTEEYLEIPYDEFVKSNKKGKSDKIFYSDLKEVIQLFETTIKNELARNIKVSELD